MNLKSITKIFRLFMITTLLLAILGSIVYVTVNDELLSRYTIFVSLAAAFLLIIGCFLNLSAATSFCDEKIALHISAEELSDYDIDSDEEIAKIPPVRNMRPNLVRKMCDNVVEFGKFHITYGLITILGILFLLLSFICAFARMVHVLEDSSSEDKSSKDAITSQYLTAAIYLVVPGVVMIVPVFILANTDGVYKDDSRNARHGAFGEYIHVPTRVIAGKAFASFLSSGFRHILQFLLGLTFILYGTYAMFLLLSMRKEDFERWHEVFQLNVYWILIAITFFAIVVGIALMAGLILDMCDKSKQSLLIIIEENWQKNIAACEILFPNRGVNFLNVLKERFERLPRDYLTTKETQAFDYISLPSWKPKREFIKKSE